MSPYHNTSPNIVHVVEDTPNDATNDRVEELVQSRKGLCLVITRPEKVDTTKADAQRHAERVAVVSNW